ncbi:helix-turn-helix domain-containing protein [Pseudomonas sp. UBA2684]|uniref:helix-turn-helix domain-containing protein n=1 Tax=Pseudomonas sp. UBA2684 TaxID=1947311 RepID=UPI000E856672|nr:helix-turn-helix transcriptional regulator [Pseudomonas sp. UBA2684]HBX54169.1 transcriptional regulator [Pseudomonas sp.]|tara:strand:- start:172 stop:486 length:315 start_codon:yes stop_codon:yes gene_type:complete
MNVQVIKRDGDAEYAVLPWADYQALLLAAGQAAPTAEPTTAMPALSQLTRLREAKGLSLDALARTVGISPHYLGMIESGERQPDDAIRRALAWHLDVAGWESAS